MASGPLAGIATSRHELLPPGRNPCLLLSARPARRGVPAPRRRRSVRAAARRQRAEPDRPPSRGSACRRAMPTPGRVLQRDPALHGPDAALDPDAPWPTAEAGTPRPSSVISPRRSRAPYSTVTSTTQARACLAASVNALGDGVVGSDSIGSRSHNPPSASAAGGSRERARAGRSRRRRSRPRPRPAVRQARRLQRALHCACCPV